MSTHQLDFKNPTSLLNPISKVACRSISKSWWWRVIWMFQLHKLHEFLTNIFKRLWSWKKVKPSKTVIIKSLITIKETENDNLSRVWAAGSSLHIVEFPSHRFKYKLTTHSETHKKTDRSYTLKEWVTALLTALFIHRVLWAALH